MALKKIEYMNYDRPIGYPPVLASMAVNTDDIAKVEPSFSSELGGNCIMITLRNGDKFKAFGKVDDLLD